MRFGLLLLCSLTITAGSGFASPINWILNGVTFADGGTASGSFIYNQDTNQYSAVNIVTTSGSVRAGATYHFVSAGFPPDNTGVLFMTTNAGIFTGTPALALFFDAPLLTNAGGTVAIDLFSVEASCGDSTCGTQANPARSVTAGVVTGTASAVPEPGSIFMLFVPAGFLALAQCRRQSVPAVLKL